MSTDWGLAEKVVLFAAALFGLGGILILAAPRLGAGAAQTAELRGMLKVQLLIVAPAVIVLLWGGMVLDAALILFAARGALELRGLAGGRPTLEIGAALLMLAACLLALHAVAARPGGAAILLIAYCLVEACDSFAAVAGRLWGRTPLLPALSPRKTVEGLAGGLAVAAPLGIVLAIFALHWSLVRAALFAAAVLGAGFAGDLLTSLLKRRQGRKDFPALLALHGGILDIYDSLLLAAPACLLFA